jgi:hypothetical protein
MAKFYVESGNVRLVVHADDAQKAAIWAVHRTMQQVLPPMEEGLMTQEVDVLEPPRVLGDNIFVSERGFGRRDAQTLETFEVVRRWNQLMAALAELEAMAA